MTPATLWAEIALASVMVIGVGSAMWSRMRPGSLKGVGARFIQLIALLVILPLIGILAMEGKLSGETAGSLIGVAIGYTLGGIERAISSRRKGNGEGSR